MLKAARSLIGLATATACQGLFADMHVAESSRPAADVPIRADAHVADFESRELAHERRRGLAGKMLKISALKQP